MSEQVVIARLDHNTFVKQIASLEPIGKYYEVSKQSLQYADCVLQPLDFGTWVGEIAVGNKVTYHEEPCPQDNCNSWCSREPVPMTIVWVGDYDQAMVVMGQEPTYDIWYYIQ
jgi:hypothetical protein